MQLDCKGFMSEILHIHLAKHSSFLFFKSVLILHNQLASFECVTVDRPQEMSQSDYAPWMSCQWIRALWWYCHHDRHLSRSLWFKSHLGCSSRWKRLWERLIHDYKVRTGCKMEMETVKDAALSLCNAGEVVCLVFLAKEEPHWLKLFWKWSPRTVIFSHSQELWGTAGQQEMALTAFFFLRRKQRCLRYALPALAGGSDKTGSLGRPMHGAVPAEYKDTPLGCCWV